MTQDPVAVDTPGDAPSTPPLLETKLYIPKLRSGLVPRPRLIERIQEGADRKLTLVTAPAGFGKTTLLADWLAASANATAAGWVSLDASENEPSLFWAYFIRALQKVKPGIGQSALSLLQSPHSPAIETVLTALINEINEIESDFVVILDDYHVIDAVAVHNGLGFLIDHMPPTMHVVVASRSAPPLPLARYRARGELVELRVADLRFTADEVSTFLNRVMALDLSATDMAKLERRTEGWIAGLKLAALSMKGRSDHRGFIETFSGDNRYIADYLVEEVLQTQPERVRRFLQGTAILDRLSGPLCDAVTGEPGSQALLESLVKSNLFVVAMDDAGEWYRYHHLFADVLLAHAIREHPDRVRNAHRRASEWYEHNGARADAVRHALGAEDMERAAALLETEWPAKDRSYQSAKWLGRVRELPDALIRSRPVLNMGYAWALLNSGELEAAEPRLDDVGRWLDHQADAEDIVIVDAARVPSLPLELASARVYLAQTRGDVQGTVDQSRRLLALMPESDLPSRATGLALVALALWANGDLEAAHRTFSEALVTMRKCDHIHDEIRGIFVLGDIRVAQGRLRDAASTYEHGLQYASEQVLPGVPETDELYLGLSELHCEWGNPDAAVRLLLKLAESADRTMQRNNRQRWCTAMARVREARGDLNGALDLLNEAANIAFRSPLPNTRPFAAMMARVRIAQGKLAEATHWVAERGLDIDDELSFIREYEHITLARVLIARHVAGGDHTSLQDATRLLARLEAAAETAGRTGSLIEILVLQAIANHMADRKRGGLTQLERALALAEPEGYFRTFVGEGPRMRELLLQATARGIAPEYTTRLLAAFGETAPPMDSADRAATPRPVDGLTARELVILRLVAAGLRNQEIADQLFISPATAKRHIANIYLKLDVSHRTEALVKAAELKLL